MRRRWIDWHAVFYTALIAAFAACAVWGPFPFFRWLGLLSFASAVITAIRGAK